MKSTQTKRNVLRASILILTALCLFLLWSTHKPTQEVPASQSPIEAIKAPPKITVGLSNAATSVLGNHALVITNTTPAAFSSATNPTMNNLAKTTGQIGVNALKQIGALEAEKLKRTPVQQKIDSQLLYADKMRRGLPVAEGLPTQRLNLDRDKKGRILVDIKAEVTSPLLQKISALGGNVINDYPEYHAIQAGVPLSEIENLAAQKQVAFIQPVVHAVNSSVDSEGDFTHQANIARANFGANGTGVKVGVISDSVDYLTGSQINGLVTVLPGQDGMPDTGEGTAMLEIVHDLAPGAQLYFATRGTSEAQFASNIKNLRSTYGCDIIVDDILYYDESPFQDGIVAQAVNTVTANGAMYFSSASNSGNQDDGTSGTWEGDFSDGGLAPSPLSSTAGHIHNFANGINADTVLGSGPGGGDLRADLFWSDPLGASTNDYDLYVLDSAGNTIIASSTNPQSGSQNPYESISSLTKGELIVIVKWSGADRFLHLSTGRGLLSVSTQGSTRGHDCTTNAFDVAATDARNSYPNSFTGRSANPVETYSSDGPRRVFFRSDGTPITPGNFSSSGGAVRQKPDITAADGVTTGVPGFAPFTGTSAAAPHAAAIAALLKSYNQSLTASQIRTILTNTALDIMSYGVDRNSGAGIVMALPALQQAPIPTPVVAPASIGGTAIGGVITSGAWPFIADSGYFLLVPADSGNSCQLIGIYDNAGVYDISTDSASYSYSASGAVGSLQLSDGSETDRGNLNYSTTNFGNYSITNISAAPILANQAGNFQLFQTPVPAAIAGKNFSLVVNDGVSPFAQSGTSSFIFAASGNKYVSPGDGINSIDSSGTYSYSKLNSATGLILLNDSVGGALKCYIVFSSAVEGTYFATQASSGSFQVGHFVLVDAAKPSLNVTAPVAGARITNPTFTAQGTASDNVQVAGIGYQLNTNDWAVAVGTTNWVAANLIPMPGTNFFRAYAVDTSGNVSTTNQVNFVYVLTDVLRVKTIGQGTISPDYSNAVLEIGKNYSMTAKPTAGFVFTNWTVSTNWIGGLLTNNSTVQFTMASNLTLQATFADVAKPTLAITNLTAGQRVGNGVFTVKGKASDNAQIANVWLQLNGDGWTNAATDNQWANWSADLNLIPGTNQLTVYAEDATGNFSPTSNLNFQFVVTNILNIRAMGLGTLSPNYSNTWLEIGRNYSIKATPKTGFVVTNWTISTNWVGGRITNNATVQFMMASNLTLAVNFADVSRPTVKISFPTNGKKMTNALATVVGTAKDNWKIAGVWNQLNGGEWILANTANNFTNWTATLALTAGTNAIKSFAQDWGGNFSTTNSISVISSNTFMLQLVFTNAMPLETNGLAFSLQLSKGLDGHIQVSSNLTSWATLTNFVGTNTTLNFRDSAATNSSQRFYRATIP